MPHFSISMRRETLSRALQDRGLRCCVIRAIRQRTFSWSSPCVSLSSPSSSENRFPRLAIADWNRCTHLPMGSFLALMARLLQAAEASSVGGACSNTAEAGASLGRVSRVVMSPATLGDCTEFAAPRRRGKPAGRG